MSTAGLNASLPCNNAPSAESGQHHPTEEFESDKNLSSESVNVTTTFAEASPFLACASVYLSTNDGSPLLVPSHRIRSIPIFAIAFLDLANSGDFAANVFNEIPVPVFAAVLMVLGATCALVMSIVALQDARHSWNNIRLLRQERQMLMSQIEQEGESPSSIPILLDLNHRDLWTEIFDRFGLEALMGIAAFIIAVGTYMAPAGANRKVFRASNLLSGYIGNTPTAVYGLCTAIWSVFVWRRVGRQSRAAKLRLPKGPIRKSLLARLSLIREHAILSGITCLVSGVMSMFTPTRWWPYPVLLVCGIAFIYSTYIYRTRIGYDRLLFTSTTHMDVDLLLRELSYIGSVRRILSKTGSKDAIAEEGELDAISHMIVRCDLFDNFAGRVIANHELRSLILARNDPPFQLTPELLSGLSLEHHSTLQTIARACFKEHGMKQLSLRKRFLMEALATTLDVSVRHDETQQSEKE